MPVPDIDIQIAVENEIDLDFPSLWGVRFLNDDYTPMEFVISVMMQFFGQTFEQAEELTVLIHEKGQAVLGAYTKDVADTKAITAENSARNFGHPLRLEAVEV